MEYATLNSATKYPSIPTYHTIDPQTGKLTEPAIPFHGPVYLSEKVDGANGRIIVTPNGDWFIGSREEILYARGDRIINPMLDIVPSLLSLANNSGRRTRAYSSQHNLFWVMYLEVYGAGIGRSGKQYSTAGAIGFRLFDIAGIPGEILDWPKEKIASWRDNGGQQFLSESILRRAAIDEGIPLTPRIGIIPAEDLPTGIEEMHEFLKLYTQTRAPLDETGFGASEGIVLRNEDRTVIAKARFQNYRRTLEGKK